MAKAKSVKSKDGERTYLFPSTVGACIDKLYALDQLHAKAMKKAQELNEEYNALEKHLFDELPKSELEGASGKTATAKIEKSPVPNVDDWDKLRAYIVRNKAWDLIQKRVSSPAFRERWNDNKVVPGVSIFTRITLKISKRKGG